MIKREVLSDGSVKLASEGSEFVYRRLRPGLILLEISGDDRGQFGTATQDEVATEFARYGQPIELYMDATAARGAATKVMEDWTAWFDHQRKHLAHVAVLISPDAKVLQLTVSIAKHLSRTGDLIAIHLDRRNFEAALTRAAPGYALSRLHGDQVARPS